MVQEKQVVIRPENQMPVDSLAAIKSKMLDPRAYGSCAKHIPGACLGCPAFDRCEEADKGDGRPRNYGVRMVKSVSRGGGIREDVMPCYVYWARKDAEEAAGSIWDNVASEGDEITIKITEPLRKDPNGVPLPGTPYRDGFKTITVPEFETIDKNLRLVNDAYRSKIMQAHHEKKKRELRESVMAPPAGTITVETTSDDTAGKPKRR